MSEELRKHFLRSAKREVGLLLPVLIKHGYRVMTTRTVILKINRIEMKVKLCVVF